MTAKDNVVNGYEQTLIKLLETITTKFASRRAAFVFTVLPLRGIFSETGLPSLGFLGNQNV
jgi:hypothetical protein